MGERRSLAEILGNARVVAWVCPIEAHGERRRGGTVDWDDNDVAHCTYPGCPFTSLGPKRIQRKRTKGWKMPADAIYVGRPTRWGNPFVAGKTVVPPVNRYEPTPVGVRDAEHAVQLYRRWITGSADRCADLVLLLAGHDLACWCPIDQPCHADVLLEIANS